MYELSAVSLQQQIQSMDRAANNIANVATPGYKAQKSDVVFQDLVGGYGVSLTEYSDNKAGSLAIDSRKGTYSLQSGSFVVVDDSSQSVMKRSITASVNERGFVVDEGGYLLQGEAGPVFVGDQDFFINSKGEVIVDQSAVDTVSVMTSDYQRMNNPEVVAGHIELSNVDLSTEVQLMLDSTRTIKSLQSGLNRYDRMVSMINDYIRDVK